MNKGNPNRQNGHRAVRRPPADGKKKTSPAKSEGEFAEMLREIFDPDNMRQRREIFAVRLRLFLGNLITNIFLSKERIVCGIVTFGIMLFLALLQTTLFSVIKPFGSVPDLMLSFVLALSVTEGRRWGAAWGIAAAVFIESLSVPHVYLLPLLYMLTGYFGGVICRHYLTESFAVRAVLSLGAIPFKGMFTAIYTVTSALGFTAGEMFFEIVLPEAAATLLLAVPIHILVYFAMKPFHHTRADMVSER